MTRPACAKTAGVRLAVNNPLPFLHASQTAGWLSAALHAAPWSARVRAALASALLAGGPGSAAAAARLCPIAPAHAADGGGERRAAAARELLRARSSAVLAEGGAAGVDALAAQLVVPSPAGSVTIPRPMLRLTIRSWRSPESGTFLYWACRTMRRTRL